MPHGKIEYSFLDFEKKESSNVFVTSLGNTIIEVQGELFLPQNKPASLEKGEEKKYVKINGDNQDRLQYAIKFGRLEINNDKATLYIGTTQRLLGDVKKLNPPLALLKFSKEDEKIQLRDVIKHKIIFTGRPLPIM